MAKKIADYGIVVCRKVVPAKDPSVIWSWRQNYIGRQGELLLLESETKHPGKTFLYFSGSEWSEEMQDYDDWYLRTGCGELSIDGNVLTFRTQNTIYTFERS